MKVVEVPIEYYICLLEYEIAHYKRKEGIINSWITKNKIRSLEANLKFYQDQVDQSAITIVPDVPIIDESIANHYE